MLFSTRVLLGFLGITWYVYELNIVTFVLWYMRRAFTTSCLGHLTSESLPLIFTRTALRFEILHAISITWELTCEIQPLTAGHVRYDVLYLIIYLFHVIVWKFAFANFNVIIEHTSGKFGIWSLTLKFEICFLELKLEIWQLKSELCEYDIWHRYVQLAIWHSRLDMFDLTLGIFNLRFEIWYLKVAMLKFLVITC